MSQSNIRNLDSEVDYALACIYDGMLETIEESQYIIKWVFDYRFNKLVPVLTNKELKLFERDLNSSNVENYLDIIKQKIS